MERASSSVPKASQEKASGKMESASTGSTRTTSPSSIETQEFPERRKRARRQIKARRQMKASSALLEK